MKTWTSLLLVAGAALVSAQVPAQEPQACGGSLPACAAGQFCQYAVGECGTTGVCQPIPGICPTDVVYVCGCDGKTYSNECQGKTQGISVKSVGKCPIFSGGGVLGGGGGIVNQGTTSAGSGTTAAGATTTTTTGTTQTGTDTTAAATGTSTIECGGPSDIQCASGYVCIFAAGNECGAAGGLGKCEAATGMMCSQEYKPVCGCDGKTYSNACVAQYQNGVSVKSEGECGGATTGGPAVDPGPIIDGGGLLEPRACKVGSARDCPLGQYCKVAEGGCTTQNPVTAGACAAKPITCDEHTLPAFTQVCGCDGTTYRTECHAEKAGVSVLYRGACFSREAATANAGPKACGGLAGVACAAASDYCAFEVGVCGMYDAQGACEPKAEVCIDSVDPVCGCDGKAYSNACEAKRAGVSVKSLGDCPFTTIDDGLGGKPFPIDQDKAAADSSPATSTNGMCNPAEGVSCPTGYYCTFETGKCLGKGAMGLCVPQPASCTPSAASHPVCGCNGHTYATECDAAMAGVSLQAPVSCLEMSQTSPAPAAASSASLAAVAVAALAAAAVALAF